jgi:transitional endoplasmic reticulum ATPase
MAGSGRANRDSEDASGGSLGQLELEVEEAYIADRTSSVARLDKHSMKHLNISAGDGVILFAGEKPVIAKAFPLYPSDNRTGIIRISQGVRKQLNREIGEEVAVRGIGNTKIDKVVNYLLLDRLSRQDH